VEVDMEDVRKIRMVYLSDIAQRVENSRRILLNMEREDIIKVDRNGIETSNAIYVFVNCIRPERTQGVLADQAIIDFREPMCSLAKSILRASCVPEQYQIIDDRKIYTSDSPLYS